MDDFYANNIAKLTHELDIETKHAERFVDFCLILRRRQNQEILLWAGGVWDRLRKEYTGDDPKRPVIVDLEESQVEFVRWFAIWAQQYRDELPRDVSLAALLGDRRGGKTFAGICCILALCIDCPWIQHAPLSTWVVSCSYQERDEIDRTIRQIIPEHWARYRKAPEYRYTFLNGAELRSVSADDPEALKRGRVDCCLYNEGQKMPVAALSNGIYGTVDTGGLAIIAANPPRRQRGEWVLTLKDAVDEKLIEGAKIFMVSSRGNTQIDTAARSRVGGLLRALDPKAAIADDEGQWLPVQDRSYPRFTKKKNLSITEPTERDITGDITRTLTGRAYRFIAGVDFQGTPHHALVVGQIFGTPQAPRYHIIDELIVEGVEEELMAALDDKSIYEPGNLLIIGDASGQWQNGKHDTRGRRSFDIIKAFRYHVLPPVLKKSDKGEFSRNPDVDDRLNLVNKLLELDRLTVNPMSCPKLAEAFKECPLKSINGRRKPYGRYSHITDALGYLCYWVDPRPKPFAPTLRNITRVPLNRAANMDGS